MKFGVSIRHNDTEFLSDVVKSTAIDFVEIAAEEFIYRNDKPTQARLDYIHDHKLVSVHGYSLSLLDPKPWATDRLQRHIELFNKYQYLAFSDHYAVASWNNQWLGSLTPAPAGGAAQELLKDRLNFIRSKLPNLPFLLENAAAPFLMEKQLSPLATVTQGIQGCDVGLLLDLSNLEANEINFMISAEAELASLNGANIAEIHLAGGEWHDGFYRDSHSSAVSPRSWDLLRKVAPKLTTDTLILIEWEQNHPTLKAVLNEVENARRILEI